MKHAVEQNGVQVELHSKVKMVDSAKEGITEMNEIDFFLLSVWVEYYVTDVAFCCCSVTSLC